MSKHAAQLTEAKMFADLHDGVMEGFGFWSRNGKYRAEDHGTFEAEASA